MTFILICLFTFAVGYCIAKYLIPGLNAWISASKTAYARPEDFYDQDITLRQDLCQDYLTFYQQIKGITNPGNYRAAAELIMIAEEDEANSNLFSFLWNYNCRRFFQVSFMTWEDNAIVEKTVNVALNHKGTAVHVIDRCPINQIYVDMGELGQFLKDNMKTQEGAKPEDVILRTRASRLQSSVVRNRMPASEVVTFALLTL